MSRWKVSQRVGGGFFGGEDGVCEPCRRGDIVNCQNPVTPGVTTDGGYAEVMIVAIGRGSDKEKLAKDLGGHIYIDTAVDDAVAVLQRMGGKRIAFCPACDHHR